MYKVDYTRNTEHEDAVRIASRKLRPFSRYYVIGKPVTYNMDLYHGFQNPRSGQDDMTQTEQRIDSLPAYYASPAFKIYEKAYNDTLDIEAAYHAQLVKEFGNNAQNARYDVKLNQSTLALSLLYEAYQKACKAMQGLLDNVRKTDEHLAAFGWKN
jgi:hypothetical protein